MVVKQAQDPRKRKYFQFGTVEIYLKSQNKSISQDRTRWAARTGGISSVPRQQAASSTSPEQVLSPPGGGGGLDLTLGTQIHRRFGEIPAKMAPYYRLSLKYLVKYNNK